MRVLRLVVGLWLIGWLSAAAASQDVVVTVAEGQLRGVSAPGGATVSFKGIPFAAPPVGELRWTPPRNPAPWRGVRAAADFAADCAQTSSPALHRIDEDCLYLNLWAPSKHVRPLPVMVWIYGGSFVGGGTSDPRIDGARLATRGVIVVTINYRTGALGYLAHPLLSRESPSGASGNYGLMDNIAALRWIRANIAAFGGDPARVTVFGQSSGGVSVNMLMAAPSARELFARAIVQSGPLFGLTPAMRTRAAVEPFGERFMAARGATTLAQMRAMPWQQMQTMTPEEQRAMPLPFAPIADGAVLPDTATHVFQRAAEQRIPLIVGSTAQENSSSVPLAYSPAEFEAWVRQTHGERAQSILAQWPHATDAQARASRVQLRSYAINEGTQYEALLHARVVPRTWLYRFVRAAPSPTSALNGADHGSDVAYTFDALTPGQRRWTPIDVALSGELIGYWTNFAKYGDPNGPGLLRWPSVGRGPGAEMRFADTPTVAPTGDIERLHLARRAEDVTASKENDR